MGCPARASSTAFVDPYTAPIAARVCHDCPFADQCLLEALRLDGAHRRGDDPDGIYGCCAGIWFEPGRMPARIPYPHPPRT